MQTIERERDRERNRRREVVRQRSQLKRAKNLCACAIDRTRLMEQLGLRGDPLLSLLPAPPLPSPLYCLPSTYFNSSFNFQLGQLSLQVFACCGLRIFFQIKPTLTSASDSELCSGQLPLSFLSPPLCCNSCLAEFI